MAVRNMREVSNIIKDITQRLLANQTLCKLLYYQNIDPLAQNDISNTKVLLHEQIKVIPKLGIEENSKPKIFIVFGSAERDNVNHSISNMSFSIFVYVPFSEWIMKGEDFKIFAILSEIEESLHEKNIARGIGKMKSNGAFLETINDYICSYRIEFELEVYK